MLKAIFDIFVTEKMHFRHISAKIQHKNLKQHFDWEAQGSWALLGYALLYGNSTKLFTNSVSATTTIPTNWSNVMQLETRACTQSSYGLPKIMYTFL